MAAGGTTLSYVLIWTVKHWCPGCSILLALLLATTAQAALQVSPTTGLTATGLPGGPFSPDRKVYTLSNNGLSNLTWTAGKGQPWVTLSSTGGFLPSRGTATVTVSINATAGSLPSGTYTDTVNFSSSTGGNTSRSVTLTVQNVITMQVSPVEGLISSGPRVGPFSPASKEYTLTNAGNVSINWTASKTQPWVSVSPASGTLGEIVKYVVVTVSINSGANDLAAGDYSDIVTFTNATNGSGNTTRGVTLTVGPRPATLQVVPAEDFVSSGLVGGPFSPSFQYYTLTNTGDASLDWTAGKTRPWVTLWSAGGTLAAGASDTVSVSIGSQAEGLAGGSYGDTVTLTNTTNGNGSTSRGVSLTVRAPVIFHVSTGGDDAHDGLSWATAKRTVQAGLDAAASGDHVWVAAGTYVQCVTLRPEVALYGGFAGDETSLWQRDWNAHVTVLDGGNAASVVTASIGMAPHTRIDGFTIRNGRAELGGGLYLRDWCLITVANNTITGNSATCGGGIYCRDSTYPTITNNTIQGNHADNYGGGIYCYLSATPILANNRLIGNDAVYDGGGIYCYRTARPTITSNLIVANTAAQGGGIGCDTHTMLTIANCTIAGNRAYDGGGIHCTLYMSLSIINTIIAFNSSGLNISAAATPSLGYNCAYGNVAYNYWQMLDPTGTNGNISADPRFVNASPGSDGTWGTADDDFSDLHLLADSPCRNAGDPGYSPASGETDIDGQPRVMGDRVDMGSDEFTWVGDVNLDGYVDVVDMLWLVESFGWCLGDEDYDPACDFNGDDCCDVVDLLDLVYNFGH